jgi:hypothetical protein
MIAEISAGVAGWKDENVGGGAGEEGWEKVVEGVDITLRRFCILSEKKLAKD